MDPVWFDDPKVLFSPEQVGKFWPSKRQTPEERINSATRFILYSTLLTYAFRRDPKVLLLALMILGAMFVLYRSGAIEHSSAYPTTSQDGAPGGACRKPTGENPMSNVLVSEYGKPSPPPACFYPTVRREVMANLDTTIPFDAGRSRSSLPEHQKNAAARQFVTMPVSTVPGAQTEFAEWCYGKKFAPLCRNDQSVCDPNARGAQLEAMEGIGADGDKRY